VFILIINNVIVNTSSLSLKNAVNLLRFSFQSLPCFNQLVISLAVSVDRTVSNALMACIVRSSSTSDPLLSRKDFFPVKRIVPSGDCKRYSVFNARCIYVHRADDFLFVQVSVTRMYCAKMARRYSYDILSPSDSECCHSCFQNQLALQNSKGQHCLREF